MSKMWWCANLQFLSEKGPMGMGQFWVPESAVGHKWSNFQPFRLIFGLYVSFQGISTWKTENFNLGPICTPFGVMTLFGSIFLSQIFFLPKFFLLNFFLTQIFFFYPNFFLPKFFFFFHFSLWHFFFFFLLIFLKHHFKGDKGYMYVAVDTGVKVICMVLYIQVI